MQQLTYGQHVRLAAWRQTATVFTALGYGGPECVERSKAHGHELFGSVCIGTALRGDGDYSAEDKAHAGSAVIADGEHVMIDGTVCRVLVDPRCAQRPVYSDPIRFLPLPGTID